MTDHRWPSGSDGPLVVFPNTTQVIESGSIWDYESVTIETGATLEVGQGSRWTIIGCKGPFKNKGTIRAIKADYSGPSPISTTAPDGMVLTHNTSISAGGNGGSAHTNGGPAPVGVTQQGNGGGGAAAFSHGNNATSDQGGAGGYFPPPGNNWRCGGGGSGGTISSPAGGVGGTIQDPNLNHGGAVGGGGGGGFRGFHGGLLYLRIAGAADFSAGILDMSGSPGGAGGAGGSALPTHFQNDIRGGGGGGGGAGGNSGHLVIRYSGNYSPGQINLNPGSGGAGGAAGSVSFLKTPPHATAGSPGANGQPSSGDISEAPHHVD
jgi:hypothetical protein